MRPGRPKVIENTFFQLVEITHYQKHWVTHILMTDIHLDATSL